ncbi:MULTISPECIES: GNAT family N-acetyltransferase [Streptomyces]|uniref:N-acetyltransferase n=1 Tax=Streptomyces fuscus TaxID=3048495 RepID=A0ABT7J3H6_9ACTN|nr:MULTISPECIES: N-acetyltransferase [Streptomyces]MCM1973389.1 N-acetyltransferase [Streptomyces sp. G1]MDL2079399.1 N-acetyltransferase [Streptomyces fuscus]
MSPHWTWTARPETTDDIDAVRETVLAAFETPLEADLVDTLRTDEAWIDGLSYVTTDATGTPVGYALLTRCHIDEVPALCLAPVAVHPAHQRTGAGGTVIEAALTAAARLGERFVTVLGHPAYYPRFGFTRASAHGIGVTFDVPDESLMAQALTEAPLPSGTIRYAKPFGV